MNLIYNHILSTPTIKMRRNHKNILTAFDIGVHNFTKLTNF